MKAFKIVFDGFENYPMYVKGVTDLEDTFYRLSDYVGVDVWQEYDHDSLVVQVFVVEVEPGFIENLAPWEP